MAKRGKRSRKLTKAQIASRYATYRKVGKRLKARGLLSPKAKLSTTRPSLAVRKRIDELAPILTGHKGAVTVGPIAAKEFRAAGRRVIGRQVIFEKTPREKVVRNKRGKVELIGPYGSPFHEIILPIGYRNFNAFVDLLRESPETVQSWAGPDGYFGFKYFGHNSLETGDANWLAEYLEHYSESMDDADNFDHFSLFELDEESRFSWGYDLEQPRQGKRQYNPRTLQDRRQASGGRGGRMRDFKTSYEKMLAKNRKASAKYRSKKAADPAYKAAKKERDRSRYASQTSWRANIGRWTNT